VSKRTKQRSNEATKQRRSAQTAQILLDLEGEVKNLALQAMIAGEKYAVRISCFSDRKQPHPVKEKKN